MSAVLNSKIDKRSSSASADAHGSEFMTRDESGVLVKKTSSDFRSIFGSNAVESVAFAVGLSLQSLDGAVCSGSKAKAVTGAISWIRFDDRFKSWSSR